MASDTTGGAWPKQSRLLHRRDFDRVYQTGRRFGSPLFTAFLARREAELPGRAVRSRVGFTTPRALGKAVLRNRVRRRLREIVRLHYADLAPGWDIVFNPRRVLDTTAGPNIEQEVRRCFGSIGTGSGQA